MLTIFPTVDCSSLAQRSIALSQACLGALSFKMVYLVAFLFLPYLFISANTFPPGTTFMICLFNVRLSSHQIVLTINCFKVFPAGNEEKLKRTLK